MRSKKWKELMCLSILLLLAMTPVVSRADDLLWTAYNDCLTQAGYLLDNVTNWTIHDDDPTESHTGPLKKFVTGSSLNMPIVTFSMEVGLNPSDTGTAGGNPTTGPAYTIFNGIIDFSPNIDSNPDNFLFIMSVEGTVQFNPGSDFYGSIAGNIEVTLQPGVDLTWEDPSGEDLDFPTGSVDMLDINTWEINPL